MIENIINPFIDESLEHHRGIDPRFGFIVGQDGAPCIVILLI